MLSDILYNRTKYIIYNNYNHHHVNVFESKYTLMIN